jgi:membrane protease YdiL (CAAX protease family)
MNIGEPTPEGRSSPATGSGPERAPSLSGRRLLGVMGAWLLLSTVVGSATVYAAGFIAPTWGRDPHDVIPIVLVEVYAALVVATALVLGRDFRAGVALKPAPGRAIVLAFAALGVAYAVTVVAHTALAPLIGPWSNAVAILRAMGSDDGRLASTGPGVATLILLRACLLAPLGEELLFRGVLFTWLRQRLSPESTIALTSLAFAVIHGFPPIFPLAFILGVALGWVRERSGSTVPTIVGHVVHNALLVAFAYATTGWSAHLPPWGGR